MDSDKAIKETDLTEDQFYGRVKIGRNLYLNHLTSIPEGFSPIVDGNLYLNNSTSIPKGFNPTVGGTLYLTSITSIPKDFSQIIGGNLYIQNVTSIAENFSPIVGGGLPLSRVVSINKGFRPNVGQDLYLSELTSIPEDFNPIVGGYLKLSSLTSIPAFFDPVVGSSLSLTNLTSVPKNFNVKVCRHLYLPAITSIPEGFSPIVGENLHVDSLEIETIPEHFKPTVGFITCFKEGKRIHKRLPIPVISWRNGKFLGVDFQVSEVLHKRGNFYKVRIAGQTKESYIASAKGEFANGICLKEAMELLHYKLAVKDKSIYKDLSLDHEFTFAEALTCYRIVTNNVGHEYFKYFVREIKDLAKLRKSKITLAKMIELSLNDSIMGKDFCKFFNQK